MTQSHVLRLAIVCAVMAIFVGCGDKKMRARVAAVDDEILIEWSDDYEPESEAGALIREELARRGLDRNARPAATAQMSQKRHRPTPLPEDSRTSPSKVQTTPHSSVTQQGTWIPCAISLAQAREAAATGDFNKEMFNASTDCITGGDNLTKAAQLLHVSKMQAFSAMGTVGPSIVAPFGKVNKNVDAAALAAAMDNLTAATLARSRRLLNDKDERTTVGVLLSATGAFVYKPGQFAAEAFNQAVAGLTMAKIRKVTDLLGHTTPDYPEALSMMLRVAGAYVDQKGRFDPKKFNTTLDRMSEADVKSVLKQMKKDDASRYLAVESLFLSGAE